MINLSVYPIHAFIHIKCNTRLPDVAANHKAVGQLIQCYASQGGHSEKLESRLLAGPLKAPNKDSQREQDLSRRESNSSTSTSGRGFTRHPESSRAPQFTRYGTQKPEPWVSAPLKEWALVDPDFQQLQLQIKNRQVSGLEHPPLCSQQSLTVHTVLLVLKATGHACTNLQRTCAAACNKQHACSACTLQAKMHMHNAFLWHI